MKLHDLVANPDHNRRSLIALLLILPLLSLMVMGITFTYLVPNRQILDNFYTIPLLNWLTLVIFPLVAGLVVGLPLLGEVYQENRANLWSSKTVESLVRPQNYLAITLTTVSFGLAAFIPLHDSVHCFLGLPANGWGWLVDCVRTS